MPNKLGELTRQEKAFASEMAKTGNPVYAAAMAGYSHPEKRAHGNLQKPAINKQIQAEQDARLHNEAVPLAYDLLISQLKDVNLAPQHRQGAAKIILNQAKGVVDATGGKNLSDLSLAETESILLALQAEHGRKQAETLEPIETAPPEHDVMS